jgi:hypothetical protein
LVFIPCRVIFDNAALQNISVQGAVQLSNKFIKNCKEFTRK